MHAGGVLKELTEELEQMISRADGGRIRHSPPISLQMRPVSRLTDNCMLCPQVHAHLTAEEQQQYRELKHPLLQAPFRELKSTPALIRDSLRGLITLERKQDSYTRLERTSSSIEALLLKRMKKTLANDTDPLEHRSFLAATIPGTGNSCLCDAFVHQIAPAAHRNRDRYGRNNLLCLSVSFDGPSGFDSANDWTVLKQANPEHALSTRLLAAYFEIPPRFFQDNFEQTGSFQVAATLQFIQEFEYSARNDSQQPTSHDQLPWLAIAVDGIQQLLGFSSWHNAQRQRRLLDKTLASLKAAVKRPAARLFVLYAGTLSDDLTTGLIESLHSQTSTSSKFDVDEEEVPEPPRVDANLESQLHPSDGIPRHIEKVLGVFFFFR
ncbi:hypothetical protein CAOG_03464 [Capsaspora owczarzaki ATCC 30864]|uniref:hypothetical protein n=1 Tax=Capsaspora owczarzaki (strain ATCC 30864) TaxID=595528 RepID=UPI0001FE5E68|nr:hypothetical protein CAOG_03464 [Capsaspora owczarzaki ATCC 30864]|eukprot:XP_004364303.1 hypothetical protein CAOG_03464 [Capsaspora owczarzaki ATCC 30864]